MYLIRLSDRIFAQILNRANRDRSGNCNPGLVVDRDIVQSSYMDFYLQSHSGIIGSKFIQ